MSISKVREDIRKVRNPKKAFNNTMFFKSRKGEYAYGDKFLGIIVPDCRKIAKKNINLDLSQIETLLKSVWHEERLIALLILVLKFKLAENPEQLKIVEFYLKNTQYVNNWDLVDASASYILGKYLLNNSRDILYSLAKSNSLWEKRIAIVATWELIRNNEYKDTFKIAKILLKDQHDLIHKATGWMLREVGKRNGQEILEGFLKQHYKEMPRTMLRYAIEHFSENKRKQYLKK